MLFIPANSWRMIVRSVEEMQDAVIFDLEDAVPVAEKETARVFSRDGAPQLKERGIDVFVRVNSISTGMTEEDLRYVVTKDIDGIMLPKSEAKEDIVRLDQLMREEEEKKGIAPGSIGIMPLLESPKGVVNAHDIAAASERVCGLAFGAGDFLRELGEGFAIARLSPDEYFPTILYARSQISIAARVKDIPEIDAPFFGLLTDEEGLIRETTRVKLMGFKGKLLIHPRHVGPVNEVFSPSSEDVDFAQQMIAAYRQAEAQGLGAASFGGRMIDYAMVSMGEDLLQRAEAIAKRQEKRESERYQF
jgi:citrate lyase subunit beta/citryl-CoA lyase